MNRLRARDFSTDPEQLPQIAYADARRRLDDSDQLEALSAPAKPSALKRFVAWLETPIGDAIGSTVLTAVAVVLAIAVLMLGAHH